MMVDVSDIEIERPQKNRNVTESGKQKCHTLKAQLLANFTTGQIICTTIDTGKTHDFKLLKRSRLPFVSSQLCLADRGSSRVHRTPCWGLYSNL